MKSPNYGPVWEPLYGTKRETSGLSLTKTIHADHGDTVMEGIDIRRSSVRALLVMRRASCVCSADVLWMFIFQHAFLTMSTYSTNLHVFQPSMPRYDTAFVQTTLLHTSCL